MAAGTAQLQAYYQWLRERGLTSLPRAAASPAPVALVQDGLAGVKARVSACNACELGRSSATRAFGFGGEKAAVLFVGDGPLVGEELWTGEERELLVKIIGALELSEDAVFFTGSVHCRMPAEQPPSRAAFDTCRAHLTAVVAAVAPKAIVVLGGLAAKALFGDKAAFPELRGKVLERSPLGAQPLVVTFHPRDLLRYPQSKRQAWADLRLIKQFTV